MIAVDGATGYLGNHVVSALRKHGIEVCCLVHPGARQKDIEFLRSTAADVKVVELASNDGAGLAALLEALRGCAAVIHLVGSIAPRKGERLEDLHAGQTRGLVEACKGAGVRKIVQVTALGTASDAASSYHRTKWQAEQIVRASGLEFVILRPSLIIGRQVGNRDSKLIARYRELIRTRNAVPLIDGGKNKLQPVFVGDLATALADAGLHDCYNGGTYEIGGADVVTMHQVVEQLMSIDGTRKRIAALPPVAATVVAAVCELVQDVPLLSRDQITLATRDNVCSDNALSTIFGITPTSLDAALATYRQPVGAPSVVS